MEKNIVFLSSNDENSIVKIDNGELISYQKNNIEYIHQKENKGWNYSDTEMFPIIGPTLKNNYEIATPKGNAILDQHGLLREFDYLLAKKSKKTAFFTKNYKKNTFLKNRKYPNKSPKEFVFWPYDFVFNKKFILTNNSLEIVFEITSEEKMPFMLGFHPAFELSGFSNETLSTATKKITLNNVFEAGANAFPVLNTNEILLHHSEKKDVKITTKGFNNFMLWTEVNSMLCIEPITQYPNLTTQKYATENLRLSAGLDVFSVVISIL